MTPEDGRIIPAPATQARSRLKLIDCDVHQALRSSKDQFPNHATRWHRHLEQFGPRRPIPFTASSPYPKTAPALSRTDSWPPNGGPPGSDLAFLQEQQVTLYLDTSGESLFKRGWRREREDKGLAPLKENLAAGLLMLAGWTPERPLLDPYCGSGTLLIEAAQIALGIAPGLSRAFGFERLRDHDPAQWAQIRGEAIRQAQQSGPALAARLSITGIDIDPTAIEQARRNIERAGVGGAGIRLAVGDAARLSPPQPGPGVIVTNPPYGERIAAHQDGQPAPGEHDAASDETHREAMAAFGRGLKERFGGWQVNVLSSDRELPRQLGIRESRKTLLYNGALECRLFRFDVFDRATREAHDRATLRNGRKNLTAGILWNESRRVSSAYY
jgi:hypothetical protein